MKKGEIGWNSLTFCQKKRIADIPVWYGMQSASLRMNMPIFTASMILQLEVSKHHLIRMFTAGTGISPGKYLVHVRMHHAKIMLQSGEDTPLEIIAGACGYSCANYFSKAFKKQTGLTPSEYAKAFRQSTDEAKTDLQFGKIYL